MALPLIIGVIAGVAGFAGLGGGVFGTVNIVNANSTTKAAQEKAAAAQKLFEEKNEETLAFLDEIGKQELDILASFQHFSDLIEKIHGRPEFAEHHPGGIELPKYEAEKLREVSVGASALIGGLGGAAVGTAGGFAAAGATTAAVTAFGAASTGTAISSLSGAAATNAVLAALGGGSLATGGGGMALGAVVLSGAAVGAALLVGGAILGVVGMNLSSKADEAMKQAENIEKEVNEIVSYFDELRSAADRFKDSLLRVDTVYRAKLDALERTIIHEGKKEWSGFDETQKKETENAIRLVGLLYTMCRTKLVLKSEEEEGMNRVNNEEIESSIETADTLLAEIA